MALIEKTLKKIADEYYQNRELQLRTFLHTHCGLNKLALHNLEWDENKIKTALKERGLEVEIKERETGANTLERTFVLKRVVSESVAEIRIDAEEMTGKLITKQIKSCE
jgi:hypothetical protein